MRGTIFALIIAFGTIFAASARSQDKPNSPAPTAAPQAVPPLRAPQKTPSVLTVARSESLKAGMPAPAAGNRNRRSQNPDATPGQAPSRAPGLENDPQYKADVTHLLDVLHVREDMMQGAGDGFDAMLAQLQDLLPDLPDKDKILVAYRKALVGLFQSQDLTDRIVAVYAQYLSDDDVKGITQFFESPAGKHYRATEGDMNNSLADAVGELGKDKVPSILNGLCTEFPDLQGKVAFCSAGQENKSVMLDSRAASNRGL